MISTANNRRSPTGAAPCAWGMTVLELAIFMAVYRAVQPIAADVLSEILSGWFECCVSSEEVSDAAANMVARGWLVIVGGRLTAAEEGRQAVRELMNGIVRILDHGTRLIDVALMMAVLKLTNGELDDGPF